MSKEIESLKRKLERESLAREAAEQLLEERSNDLYNSLLEIQDSENLLKKALSSMLEGLLLTTPNHDIILCNEQLKTLYPENSHVFHKGMNIEHLFSAFTHNPAFLHMQENNLQQCTFELTDTDERTIAVSVKRGSDGTLASTHRNITATKAATQEQQKLLFQLMQAQRMESIGKMAGGIAHDFNNIIAAIKGYAGFLDEDIPEDPNLRNSVDKILKAAQKAEDLVQHILDYGQADKVQQVEAIEVQSLVKESLHMIEATLDSNIKLECTDKSEPLYFAGNPSQLSQILMNILTNAVRAIGKTKGKISIQWEQCKNLDLNQPNFAAQRFLSAEPYTVVAGLHIFSDPCIKLTIRDTGCGMDQHVLDHLFDLHFSTKKEQGHGMGMSTVVRLVTEHSGGIKIYSKPNHGTVCEIVIPAETQNLPKTESEQSNTQPQAQTPSRVLIIDDDEEVGLMLFQTLKRAGIDVEFANSSITGLECILKSPEQWQAIISDQMMPVLKGTDLLLALREQGYNTPFIIYSGHISNDSHSNALHLADHVLKKPLEKDKLLAVLDSYLTPAT